MSETPEDRTFRLLSKTPIAEVERLLKVFSENNHWRDYDSWIELKVRLLRSHGWSLYEYNTRNIK